MSVPNLPKYLPLCLAAILSTLTGFIYGQGLAPSVATIFDDSLEFPLVVHRLAIAHPTGYPLYTLLGKLFSLFNPTQVAYQLNLMSAVFGALSVGLVYLCCLQIQTSLAASRSTVPADAAHHAGAMLAATIFGLGPIFYSQATIAEVYTLHAFFIALLLLLTLHRRWLWLAFVIGLSLTHHRTIILLWAALSIFALSNPFCQKQISPQPDQIDNLTGLYLSKMIGLSILPLSLYLYIPLRGHVGSLDGTYENTWMGFWDHVLARSYNTFLFDNPLDQSRSLQFYGDLFQTESGWWGLGFALTGLVCLCVFRAWQYVGLTGVAFLSYLIFNLLYTISDIAVFFIPLFLISSLWMGVAIGQGFSWLLRGSSALIAVAMSLGLYLLIINHNEQSRAEDWQVHYYGLDMLTQAATNSREPQTKAAHDDASPAAIVGILGEMTLLRYFQEVLDLYPEIKTFPADLDQARRQQIDFLIKEAPTRPLYITRPLAGLPEKYSLTAVGPLIRVYATPRYDPPPVDQRLNIALNPGIDAYGYRTAYYPIAPHTEGFRLEIVWYARENMITDFKISARLLDSTGNMTVMVDKVPVHFAYPTTAWRAGEFIIDVYDFHIAPDLPRGPYTPLLILYEPAQGSAERGRVALPAIWFK